MRWFIFIFFLFALSLTACPEIVSTYPPHIIRTDSLDIVRIVFEDFGVPLDTSIVMLEIDGTPYDISDTELYLIGEDTLVYSGLPYAYAPDTIEICVHYDDMNKTCDTTMVYCWETAILPPCPKECRVLIDSLHGHPNDYAYDSFFTQYASFIRDTFGYDVVMSPDSFYSLDNFGILFLMPIDFDYDSYPGVDKQMIQNWVYNGGFLIVRGEWNTIMGRIKETNNLLADPEWDLGVTVNEDIVFSPAYHYSTDWRFPKIFCMAKHPFMEGVDTLLLGWGGSLNVDTTKSLILARGAEETYSKETEYYSIPDTVVPSSPSIISLSHHGKGLILSVSDLSVFVLPATHAFDTYWETWSFPEFAWNIHSCDIRPRFLTEPEEMATIGSPLDEIRIIIQNYGEIVPDSVRVSYDGIVYDIADTELTVTDSIIGFHPPYGDSFLDTIVITLETVIDTGGYWPFGPIDFKFISGFDNIEERENLPEVFEITAQPNPFNSAVTITLDGVGADLAPARIEIYDVNGRRVAEIIPPHTGSSAGPPLTRGEEERKSPLSKGRTVRRQDLGGFVWTPDPSLGSGVYLVRAKAGDVSSTKRIVFLK